MKEILLDIINKIRKSKKLEPLTELNDDMSLRNDLGFDSLDLAELTVRVENEFGIDIFEDSIVNSVGEIFQKLSK